MDAVTIFVAHEPKTFDGQNGAWTLHKFKDQNGTYFQTTKQQLANAAYALLNKPAAVTFDVEERQSGNRTYKNNVISAVVPAPEGAALTPTSNPGGGGGGGGGNRGGGYRGKSAEEQSVINRSAALARSIEAHAAGLVKLENREQLFAFSDVLVSYIEGPKTAPTAQGAVSSDGGGAAAGVEAPTSAPAAAPAETAPAAAPAAVAPGPDDDIPF